MSGAIRAGLGRQSPRLDCHESLVVCDLGDARGLGLRAMAGCCLLVLRAVCRDRVPRGGLAPAPTKEQAAPTGSNQRRDYATWIAAGGSPWPAVVRASADCLRPSHSPTAR